MSNLNGALQRHYSRQISKKLRAGCLYIDQVIPSSISCITLSCVEVYRKMLTRTKVNVAPAFSFPCFEPCAFDGKVADACGREWFLNDDFTSGWPAFVAF